MHGGESTKKSYRAAIFYVDLALRDGLSMQDAVRQAHEIHQARLSAGIDQQALDDAARRGFANALFEDSEEEVPAILEEFYPPPADAATPVEESDTPPAHSLHIGEWPERQTQCPPGKSWPSAGCPTVFNPGSYGFLFLGC